MSLEQVTRNHVNENITLKNIMKSNSKLVHEQLLGLSIEDNRCNADLVSVLKGADETHYKACSKGKPMHEYEKVLHRQETAQLVPIITSIVSRYKVPSKVYGRFLQVINMCGRGNHERAGPSLKAQDYKNHTILK